MDTKSVSIILGPLVFGMLVGLSNKSSMAWYDAALQKPSWSPPKWVFGPVWTLLYLAMGYALFRVYKHGGAPELLLLFGMQMVLNLLWTPVFFGARDPASALLVIGMLGGLLLPLTYGFWKVDHMAGYIMIPYVVWTAFASALNTRIVQLN